MKAGLLRNFLILLGVIALVIITGICVNAWKDQQLVNETTKRVVAEEKIKQLAYDHQSNKKFIDSILTDRAALVAVIEYQKSNPQIIIKKYEAIHHNIDLLSPDDGFKLFTSNIRDYNANRKRYSLSRFNR